MPSPSRPTLWTVIVPVKQTTLAKTRLTGIDVTTRRALAVAFARDTVAAALASPLVDEVVVVSSDAVAADLVAGRARVVPDAPDAGLNPALTYAADQIRSASPGASIAAISSDLPALRGDDLTRVFESAPAVPWFVADGQGVGTTMLASPGGTAWTPEFGGASRAAHLRLGVVEIELEGIERLRRDVDTVEDLWDAQRLGVGAATRDVLAATDRRRLA